MGFCKKLILNSLGIEREFNFLPGSAMKSEKHWINKILNEECLFALWLSCFAIKITAPIAKRQQSIEITFLVKCSKEEKNHNKKLEIRQSNFFQLLAAVRMNESTSDNVESNLYSSMWWKLINNRKPGYSKYWGSK